jgi:hypothetical protein
MLLGRTPHTAVPKHSLALYTMGELREKQDNYRGSMRRVRATARAALLRSLGQGSAEAESLVDRVHLIATSCNRRKGLSQRTWTINHLISCVNSTWAVGSVQQTHLVLEMGWLYSLTWPHTNLSVLCPECPLWPQTLPEWLIFLFHYPSPELQLPGSSQGPILFPLVEVLLTKVWSLEIQSLY